MIGTGIGLGLAGYRLPTAFFNPLDISGLQLWLDASDSSTLLQSSGGSLATADGDPVGEWRDKSGNGKHFSQASGTNKPSLRTNVKNGRNVCRFDGVDDYLQLSSNLFGGSSAFTLFFVAKQTTISTGGYYYSLHVALKSGLYSFFGIGFNGRSISTIQQAFSGNTACYSDTGKWSSNTWGLDTTVFNGSQTGDSNKMKKWQREASQTLFFESAITASSIYSQGTTSEIGGNSGAGYAQNLSGDISEIISYTSALSQSDVNRVQNYLIAKWGL